MYCCNDYRMLQYGPFGPFMGRNRMKQHRREQSDGHTTDTDVCLSQGGENVLERETKLVYGRTVGLKKPRR